MVWVGKVICVCLCIVFNMFILVGERLNQENNNVIYRDTSPSDIVRITMCATNNKKERPVVARGGGTPPPPPPLGQNSYE